LAKDAIASTINVATVVRLFCVRKLPEQSDLHPLPSGHQVQRRDHQAQPSNHRQGWTSTRGPCTAEPRITRASVPTKIDPWKTQLALETNCLDQKAASPQKHQQRDNASSSWSRKGNIKQHFAVRHQRLKAGNRTKSANLQVGERAD